MMRFGYRASKKKERLIRSRHRKELRELRQENERLMLMCDEFRKYWRLPSDWIPPKLRKSKRASK